MATVPQASGLSVKPISGPLNVRAPEGAFGPTAAVLGAGAQEMRASSDSLARLAETQAAVDNKVAVDGATVALSQTFGQLDEDFRNNNKGIAASDNLVGAFKTIEEKRGGIAGTLKSPAAQAAFNSASRIATVQLTQRLASFASAERKDYNTKQVASKVDLLVRDTTPDNFDTNMDLVGKELAFLATPQMQGWSPEEFQAEYAKVRGAAAFNITSGLAPTAPGKAQEFYDTHKGDMNPQQRTQAEAYIRSSDENLTVAGVADEYTAHAAVVGPAAHRAAIAAVESVGSGDYRAVGPTTKSGDRAYGKYQVMGANIPRWTKQVLGKEMTAKEFVANPAAQDAVFDAIFGGYVEKYGSPQEAASVWFTGKPLAQGAARKDVNGVSGAEYVRKFSAALGEVDTLDALESNAERGLEAIAADPRLHGDPRLINRAQSQYLTNINQKRAVDNLANSAAYERLGSAALQSNITDPAQLQKAYPGALEDWTNLSAKTQRALTASLTAQGNAWTPEKQSTYYALQGMRYNNPTAFMQANIAASDLPDSAKRTMFEDQQALIYKTQKDTFVTTSVNRALNNEFILQGLKAAGWDKDTPEYNMFTGALAEELSEWAGANPGKKMGDKELAAVATPLLAKRTVPAGQYFLGQRLGSTTMERPGFTVPEAEAERIRAAIEPSLGRKLADYEIGQLYQRGLNANGGR